ncbi:hypothetical protein [Streptomyces sp. CC219B]|uniref:hypothetical protein n=1 Tax=Streptomyces sp. CC219B TaxID=3044574 RepID=UPI0024A8F89B|nr:hypothetical protein [Streptomyces sp. CC219B]
MRGLADEATGTTGARKSLQAVITALAVLAALALSVAACATGGTGTRDEGPAYGESAAGAVVATPSSPPSAYGGRPDQADVVRIIKQDPQVSEKVKLALKPCVADDYPIDVSYGDLTGGASSDVVVNVVTCGDQIGVGSYVYREANGSYENVFATEESPVYAQIDRGDLLVSKQVYEKGDPVSRPSGENVITYRWTANRFTQTYFWHNDYGASVGDEPSPVPAG